MKLKRKVLIILIVLIFIIVWYNFTFTKPIQIVYDILSDVTGNEFSLDQDEIESIEMLIVSAKSYALPSIDFNSGIDYLSSKRDSMVLNSVWFDENTNQDIYISQSVNSLNDSINVSVNIKYLLYDPDIKPSYELIGNAHGTIIFEFKKAGFLNYQIRNILIYPLEMGSNQGVLIN
jgi:hypothetical protein